ncbi:MAG: hypothetical protein ACJ05G_02435 [Actinomycetota bacterium]|nr:hypothetical protein [Acidimicrobiales bacterium]
MAGGIVMAALLLLSPFIIPMSLAALAALMGGMLKRDAEERHEGSSLVETNY